MYVPRRLASVVRTALSQFPAVLVTGPRQSGKSVFLREEAEAGVDIVTLDDPFERQLAVADPNAFLDRFGDRPLVVDEIQYAPELLPQLNSCRRAQAFLSSTRGHPGRQSRRVCTVPRPTIRARRGHVGVRLPMPETRGQRGAGTNRARGWPCDAPRARS